jgi:hypothetical protein
MPDRPSTASAVDPRITGAISQANLTVVGESPSMAMGSLYQTISNSVSMASANAVYAQLQANAAYQATSTVGVSELLDLPVQ